MVRQHSASGRAIHTPAMRNALWTDNNFLRAFQDSYAGFSDSQMMQPGVTKAWSVRDILVHVINWGRETLKHLPHPQGWKAVAVLGAYGGINAFNAQVRTRDKHLSLSETFREQSSTHSQVVAFIENTPEENIRNDTRFRRRLRLRHVWTLSEARRGYTELEDAAFTWVRDSLKQAGLCTGAMAPYSVIA